MFGAVILCVVALISVNGQRIAGGDPVNIQQFPFSAALLTNNGQGTTYNYGCGGTVISTRSILSAAKCFFTDTDPHPASRWRARVGSTFSNTGGTVYLINTITPHPEFSSDTLANNIALLRTTFALVLVPGSVQVARISGAAYMFTNNQIVSAIGWGAVSNQDVSPSRQLQRTEVFTIDQTTCTNRWAALNFTVTASNVCTGWLDVGVVGQCEGDSGSPLLDSDENFVIGVFSHTEGCANSWYPDINTRLQPYISWIFANAV